jgi:hypothetical protein
MIDRSPLVARCKLPTVVRLLAKRWPDAERSIAT